MFFKWCVGEMDSVSWVGEEGFATAEQHFFPLPPPYFFFFALLFNSAFAVATEWASACLLAEQALLAFACYCLYFWRKDEAWHTTACSAKTPQESWPSLSLALSFLSSVPMLLSSQHFTLCTLSLNYSGDRQPHSVKQGLLLMSNKDFFCVDLFCGEANRSFFVKVIFWSSVIK